MLDVLLFSSPWLYYHENLYPLAKKFKEYGHNINMSYFLHKVREKHCENIVFKDTCVSPYFDFINGKYKPDVVILTQPWWEYEKEIVKKCISTNIPFFVLEHSPQMLIYSEKSSKYRNNIMGAKAHIMWGESSFEIMRKIGANADLPILGSPRIEFAINESKNIEKENLIVIYTTSCNYTSDNFFEKIKKIHLASKEKGWKVEVQAHPRFGKNNDAFKYICENKLPFHQNTSTIDSINLLKRSKISIYDFPSSVMPLSCFFNNDIYYTYSNSKIKEIREYGESHNIFIKDLSKLDIHYKNENFNEKNNFLKRNISIEKKSSSKRIYEYIVNSL